MTPAFSWNLSPDEEVCTTTPDGVALKVFCYKGIDGTTVLDLAPRFRYIVRISDTALETFSQMSALALYHSSLMLLPYIVEAGATVKSVVVMSFNDRSFRIGHTQPLEPHHQPPPNTVEKETPESEAKKQAWTTQSYRHHRSPQLRPTSSPPRQSSSPQENLYSSSLSVSKRDSEGSGNILEMPPRSFKA